MAKPKVFFLDDDPEFLRAIQFAMSHDFDLILSSDYHEAENLLQIENFDLVALDYELGLRSAEEILSLVKPNTPVLIVTGKADKEIAIRLLNMQVSGLIEKPMTATELSAKIKSLLFRQPKLAQEEIASLMLTLVREQRKVIMSDQTVLLTPTEFKIFDVLLEARGRKIQREDLCHLIWGNIVLSKNTLDTHLTNLKRKVPVLNEKLKALYGSGIYLDV